MSGNLKFFEQLKVLFADIENLLHKQIKEASLAQPAKQKKDSILQKIKEIKNDYPQLETEDTYEESIVDGQDGVPAVSPSDLTNQYYNGYLDKKRKEKSGLIGRFGKNTQKRYCILSGGIFYYFEKESDKKQHGHVILKGYQARVCTENKHGLEIYAEGKRCYQFVASSADLMNSWIQKINECAGIEPEGPMEEYEDTIAMDLNPHDDNIYEPYQDGSFSVNPETQTSEPPDDVYEDTAVPEDTIEPEIYDDSIPPPPPIEEDVYEDGISEQDANLPPPPPNVSALHSGTIAHELSQKLAARSGPKSPSVVSEASNQSSSPNSTIQRAPLPDVPSRNVPELPTRNVPEPPARNVPEPPARNIPEPPSSKRPPLRETAQKPLPVPPVNDKPLPQPPGNEDLEYDSLYRGLWDCSAAESNELEFKRGDLIHILSKKYDGYAWWVGKINDKIGLVPRDYVMKAYERIK